MLGSSGDSLTVTADAHQDARHRTSVDVLVLGGRPIREPVAMYRPFAMNTRQELLQAFEDYQCGRLGVIPAQVILGHPLPPVGP